jgi:RDD family
VTGIVYGGINEPLSSQISSTPKHSALGTKLLRLAAFTLVGISVVAPYVFTIGEIGTFMQVKNGRTVVSAGSHPAIVVWDVVAIGFFVALMFRKPNSTLAGVPSRWRRSASFVIDFWFSLLVMSSIGALLPLALEGLRTGHFAWQFRRDYAVSTDGVLGVPSVFIFMALVFLYYVFPLTRGRQTVGCFIMRLRTLPPFGDGGCFTFRAAMKRTFYEFRGLSGMLMRPWKRDAAGRTWYDVETNCEVVLVEDD